MHPGHVTRKGKFVMRHAAVIAVFAALAAPQPVSACTPVSRMVSCLPVPGLCEADALPDSDPNRENARLLALDGGLRSKDPAARDVAWGLTAARADLRPLAAAIRDYDELETRAWVEAERARADSEEPFDASAVAATASHGAVAFLERNELRWSSRSDRASRYREAIVLGRLPIGSVAVLTADKAVELAAGQGFEELDELLGPLLAEPGRARLRCLYALRMNLDDGTEADVLAVTRLNAIEIEEFTRRLADEAGFPEAIRTILDDRGPIPDDPLVARLSAAFKPLSDRNRERQRRRVRGEDPLPEDELEKRLQKAMSTVFPRRGC